MKLIFYVRTQFVMVIFDHIIQFILIVASECVDELKDARCAKNIPKRRLFGVDINGYTPREPEHANICVTYGCFCTV